MVACCPQAQQNQSRAGFVWPNNWLATQFPGSYVALAPFWEWFWKIFRTDDLLYLTWKLCGLLLCEQVELLVILSHPLAEWNISLDYLILFSYCGYAANSSLHCAFPIELLWKYLSYIIKLSRSYYLVKRFYIVSPVFLHREQLDACAAMTVFVNYDIVFWMILLLRPLLF